MDHNLCAFWVLKLDTDYSQNYHPREYCEN